MKNIPINCGRPSPSFGAAGRCQVAGDKLGPASAARRRVLSRLTPHVSRAFTIVELLTVIAIIAILAGILLPVLTQVKIKGQKAKAKIEIGDLVTAIQQYDSVYGRFPVSAAAQNQAGLNAQAAGNPDFTYGGVFQPVAPATPVKVGTPFADGSLATNSEVIGILMDLTNYPNGSLTINTNHQKNPQRTIFLNAKMSGYDPAENDPTPPAGVDITGLYRDPWGNPYIITLDLNYDEMSRDAFYCSNMVSSLNAPAPTPAQNPGLNGLVSPETAIGNNFEFHSKVMVWSVGPPISGKPSIDPAKPATDTANKNHILSWQ